MCSNVRLIVSTGRQCVPKHCFEADPQVDSRQSCKMNTIESSFKALWLSLASGLRRSEPLPSVRRRLLEKGNGIADVCNFHHHWMTHMTPALPLGILKRLEKACCHHLHPSSGNAPFRVALSDLASSGERPMQKFGARDTAPERTFWFRGWCNWLERIRT